MAEEFDWSSEHVVVRHYGSIAVYKNPRDDIVVRQRGAAYDEDVFIAMSKADAQTVVDAILALLKE